MPSSKRLSDKKELFTLADLAAWLEEAHRIGMPLNAMVRANVSWRGRIREIWCSDEDVEQMDQTPFPVGPDGILSPKPEVVDGQYPEDSQDFEPPAPCYVPRQQIAPGGPLHGGFTVVEGKPSAEEPFS